VTDKLKENLAMEVVEQLVSMKPSYGRNDWCFFCKAELEDVYSKPMIGHFDHCLYLKALKVCSLN